jgi:hypothetical protein
MISRKLLGIGTTVFFALHDIASLTPQRLATARVSSGEVAPTLTATGGGRSSDAAEARRRLREEAVGTYIGDVLRVRDSAIVRWPNASDQPIRVWIRESSSVRDWSPVLVERARAAFDAWEETGIPIRFRFVSDSADADAQLTWIDRFAEPVGGRAISGLTRWGVDDRSRIVDASITIAIHRASGDPLTAAAVEAMALHEVGHLLGLDHCADDGSVMAPTVQVRSLSLSDRATVRLLYALPVGTLK